MNSKTCHLYIFIFIYIYIYIYIYNADVSWGGDTFCMILLHTRSNIGKLLSDVLVYLLFTCFLLLSGSGRRGGNLHC